MNELDKIIENFLTNYTFNNIDILLSQREILGMEKEQLEDKLIKRKRGGYCFENNQYMYNFLSEKGYVVRRTLGRVVYGGTNEVTRTHQVSIVSLNDELILVDVGFGPYTPGVSVKLDGSEVMAFNGNRYRIMKLNDYDYELQVFKPEGYFSLYQFNLVVYNNADFKVANYYTNTHPDSKFTQNLTLSQLDKRGMKFLVGLKFSTLFDGERVDLDIQSEEEFQKIIRKYFDVAYSNEELQLLYKLCHKAYA